MNRFGSSKLRIIWACLSLLVAGLVIGGVQPAEGGNLTIFGTPVTLSSMTILVDPAQVFRGALTEAIGTLVPFTLLLTAILPLMDTLRKGSLKDLLVDLGLGLLNGLFYSQILLLPIWAASYRLLGHPFPSALCLADLSAILLGLQLTLWTGAMLLLVRSNAGVALLLAIALQSLGKYMTYGGEYLADLAPNAVVKTMAFLGRLLPTGHVSSDPFAWSALPLSVGVPLVLLVALTFLPKKKGKA